MAPNAAHANPTETLPRPMNEVLRAATVTSTLEGLLMTGITPKPVSTAIEHVADTEFSVLVSLWGPYAGAMYLNLSRPAASFLSGRFLGEDLANEDDLMDCICEFGNMIAGRFKENLRETLFATERISLPSLIVGMDCTMYHARGMIPAEVVFEIEEMTGPERFFSTSIWLIER